MGTFEAIDPSDPADYKCADGAFPTESYNLVLNDIQDSNTGCSSWVGSGGLSNYVTVNGQALDFAAATTPTSQWAH